MNNIILLRKRQQDKTFTIYIHKAKGKVTLVGLCFKLRDTRKITRPDSKYFFSTNFTQKASLFRGRSVNPILLLHYLMQFSIIIHQKINAISQLHSDNDDLEK